MKRTITRGLLFIGALLISGISAEAVKIDGINYTIPRYGSKASVGKNSNLEDNIVIKETIESGGKTYTVTSIDKNAFLDCKLMYSITLPKTITKIEQNAFYGCVGLNVGGVHISDLKAWCETKFNGDYSQPLEFANKLYIDGEEVTELVIPDGVEKISDNAFFGCDNITSLTIPSSVKEIGNYAFRDFKKLQSLTIGEGLETIGESAFQNASSLTSLVLPNTTKTLKAYAFSGCNSLQSVTFGNSVETVLESAFSSCTSIKEVNISDIAAWSKINFKRNDSQPLYYAHNLYLNGDAITELEIPEGVETIGTNAFLGLSSINSAIIPNSVKTISTGAFLDCTGLREVTIGESVETIGISSFSGCAGLEELTIPNSTKKISTDAFKTAPDCKQSHLATAWNGLKGMCSKHANH